MGDSMPTITIHNLSEEVHRALEERAAKNGRTMEAEIREILEATVRPQQRVKLASMLAEIGREAGLTDEDCAAFEDVRRSMINPRQA